VDVHVVMFAIMFAIMLAFVMTGSLAEIFTLGSG